MPPLCLPVSRCTYPTAHRPMINDLITELETLESESRERFKRMEASILRARKLAQQLADETLVELWRE
jgi:hypothetical protein